MEKPEPKHYIDIHKAIAWAEHKLGKDLMDVAEDPRFRHTNRHVTYLEFLGEQQEASQGSLIGLPSSENGPPWVQEATKTLKEEFGEDCLYYYWW